MGAKREFFASSLKEAISKAAAEFGAEEEKIKYEIITEKTKYFGHSQREIYIYAWASDGSEQESLTGFIKSMIRTMSVDLDFSISNGKDFLKVDFNGSDYKLMLYRNGNLLNAVQYILNRLFSDSVGKKIYCECEKFRRNREYELSNLAHRYARDVRRSGKSINLKELNPFERRIIHMTINRYSDLESKSAGDSFTKIITIKKK
ncbi:MAG: Jag N-terminal domain-containing protein [Candidatus Aminicenantes bacterium]|nr:Jag N-terminal domain-containing protein [Candidatus Aminicenantes bacterium]